MRPARSQFWRNAFCLFTLALASLPILHGQAFGATESVLWSFGNGTDGSAPYAGLLADTSGNLYGTTIRGGTNGEGAIFELTPGDGGWSESLLWSFGSSGTDGQDPYADLIADPSGNLYGTTIAGGAKGGGTVFKLKRPVTSGGTWSESVLWNFNSAFGQGPNQPDGGLIMDASGNLYGTTYYGSPSCVYSSIYGTVCAGTVFELTPSPGGNWTESTLWNFNFGSDPIAGVIMDSGGNLYGTTASGGAYYNLLEGLSGLDPGGTAFELTPPASGGGTWTWSTLWNFGNGSDGIEPYAGLIIDTSGNLYGTTTDGGLDGIGTVFELMPPTTSGGNWTESVLWNFDGNNNDGAQPYAGLLLDTTGQLYGTTALGGIGTVFKLTPPGSGGGNWVESILSNFGEDGAGGIQPKAGLIIDASRKLYGTTTAGGAYDGGTVFEVSDIDATPTPTATPTITPTPIATGTPTPIATGTPTPIATATPAPTPTPLAPGPAALTISPKTFAFGNVDYAFAGAATKVRKLTITNPKKYATAAIISSIVGPAGFVADPACNNVTIAPGAKLVCDITYAPTGLGGVSGALTINANVPGGSQTIGLSGAGIQGRLIASPGTLNLGKIPLDTTNIAKTVTLRNRTASTFTISSISNGNPAFVATQNCVAPLVGSATCAISVTYTPTVTTRETDTLTITDEPDGITRTITLIGTGK